MRPVGRVTPCAPRPARLSVQMQTGKPAITIQGTVAARYQLQSSPSLVAPNWNTVTNLLLPAVSWQFIDTSASNTTSQIFYRSVGIY